MKTLFKICIIFFLIALNINSFGQSLSVSAGFNFSNMLVEKGEASVPYDYYSNADTKGIPGFHAGVMVEFPVQKWISIETGLRFITRGTSTSINEPFGTSTLLTKNKYGLSYIDLPLNIKIPYSTAGMTFYGTVGGYLGIGVTGKINTKSVYADTLSQTDKRTISWGSDASTNDLKRLDYGVSLGAGIQFKAIQAGISYNLGLANISSQSDYRAKKSNRDILVSVSYMFMPGKTKTKTPGETQATIEKPKEQVVNTDNNVKEKPLGKKAAALEAEKQRIEKLKADSIASVRIQEERLRIEKARTDSIESARVMAEKLQAEKARIEKAKADSIATAQNTVIYRVQIVSNSTKKGSYNVTIGNKNYSTWEYLFNGAYRSTVGEFKTFAAAMEFQKSVRQSGFPQAFVVAFKNNARTTDPALFK